jgi:hypothetical protein
MPITLEDIQTLVISGTVANYSALPAANTVPGQYYWVLAEQGLSWIPSWLGGNYYNKGIYRSNGTIWEYQASPANATQGQVDAGINNDTFVTPLTLANTPKVANAIQQNGNTFGVPVTIGSNDNQDVNLERNNITQIQLTGAGTILPQLTGTGIRVVESSALGLPSATKELIDGFLSAGATATLLSNTANWNLVGVYIGTAITGTYQGQQYYDSNYYFVCVDDNDWIRIPRA